MKSYPYFLFKENQKEKKLTNRGRCIALRYYNNNPNIQRELFASHWMNCNKTLEICKSININKSNCTITHPDQRNIQ